ncbi:MAG: 1-acyl-sn-glycerol-3-phosphate acyltransferase [Deltaproteobacteria bacterium]|nr:1-acyl-sn-glycerol-3-phosphate acyltransferase [Deltaproteobacteria bacterium]
MSGSEKGPASGTSLVESTVHWLGVGAHSILWPSVSFAWGLVERTGPRQHALMNIWSRGCLRSAGVRVSVRGLEHVLRDRPQIFFSNHASIADICVLGAILPVEYRWLARKEVFSVPFIGWYLTVARHLKIDRGDRSSAIRLLNEAAERVRSGTNVLVFPEGTRSPDGNLLPFKKGVFHLALAAGVPIVPIRLLGSGRIIPKGSMRLGAAEVEVVLGAPISTEGLGEADLPALMDHVRDAMVRLGDPALRGFPQPV